MSAPHIPAFSRIPSRGSAPETFSGDTDAFLSDLVGFQVAANDVADFINGAADSASTDSATATTKAAEAVTARNQAVAAQTASESARSTAESARDTAVGARNTAVSASGDASAAAGNALLSATSAATARDKAQAWAESNTAVEPGKYSAKWHADRAQAIVSGDIIDDDTIADDKVWSSQKVAAELAGIDLSGKLSTSGGQLTGPIYFSGEYDNGSSGTAMTIDWSLAQNHKLLLNGNCTLTFAPPAGVFAGRLSVTKDNSGTARAITWPAGTKFLAGVPVAAPQGANGRAAYAVYWSGADWTVLGGPLA